MAIYCVSKSIENTNMAKKSFWREKDRAKNMTESQGENKVKKVTDKC